MRYVALIVLLGSLLVAAGAVPAAGAVWVVRQVKFTPPPPPPPPSFPDSKPRTHAEMAAELLDGLQSVFDGLKSGTPEADLGHELSGLAADGRAMLASGIVTPAFHQRLARVLLVVRLAIITDTGRILAPIVDREFIAFVRDATGRTYDPAGPVSEQIGRFSDAVAIEITRLRAMKR